MSNVFSTAGGWLIVIAIFLIIAINIIDMGRRKK